MDDFTCMGCGASIPDALTGQHVCGRADAELVIHSMFGPTVYAGSLEDLPALLDDLKRLNTPASNSGRYALILTVRGEECEIVPMGTNHTHGYRVFCAPCHRAHERQWQNPQPGDTVWP